MLNMCVAGEDLEAGDLVYYSKEQNKYFKWFEHFSVFPSGLCAKTVKKGRTFRLIKDFKF